MSSSNLLNIDVDKLFEQYSVVEINAMQKKIQEVIENKKEELRTMVGERYRDLLKAADTITCMQQSSKALITEVNKISGCCKNLNDQHLLGFKSAEDMTNNLRERNDNKQVMKYYSTIIQIKLLIILPDLIWSNLDREQYYGATDLFLFSRHISTGLQLNANNDVLIQKLPIAKKQWETLRPFYHTIKQHVLLALESDQLTNDLLVDCIMALLQLERTTLTKVLKCFLDIRSTVFLNCLTREKSGGRVKGHILTSLDTIYNSLELIEQCFMEENGLLLKRLKEHSNSTVCPTISRIPIDNVQFAQLLPDIILQFKPKFENITLHKDAVEAALKEWYLNITSITDKQLKELFQFVVHMNVIQDIKLEATNLHSKLKLNEKNVNSDLVHSFNLKNFYELHYVPLINQRICDIIHDNWSQAINDVFHDVDNVIKLGECHQINGYTVNMWTENLTDLPQSLTKALNQDVKQKQLLMKFKGYDQQIILICTKFDDKLNMIIKEIKFLLTEDLNSVEEKDNFKDFLRKTAQTQLNEFLTKVMTLQLPTSTSSTLSSFELLKMQQEIFLFLIHCCCALIELCPHLKLCFCYEHNYWRETCSDTDIGTSAANGSRVNYWHDICVLFEDHIHQLWVKIIDNILTANSCENYLSSHLNSHVILEDFPLWDCVTLEQKIENDQTIKTDFHLPKQPCISLQIFLHTIITKLNEAVPQNLPSRILKIFNEKLMQHLLQYYDNILENHKDELPPTQNVALQMYFDLKFLQNMFDVKERSRKEQFNTLQSKYKNYIDPFDFELLAEHILNNIQRSVEKLKCLLGVLTPLYSQTNFVTGIEKSAVNKKSSNLDTLLQEEEPSILRLCSNSSTSIWFPLLPIVSTNSTELLQNSEGQKNAWNKISKDGNDKTAASTKKPNERKTANKMKTSTTSFFGTMSQEWFR